MKLPHLRNWMQGEDCVVAGCGPSAQFEHPWANHWTIACNRMVPIVKPDFALCVEPYKDKALWHVIRQHAPLIIFSHICSNPETGRLVHQRVVQIGSKNVETWLDPDGWHPRTLRLGQSTFFALAVAIHLGFETIGVIGLDMTRDRFAKPTVRVAAGHYRILRDIAEKRGQRIVNLSTHSRLKALEFGGWDQIRGKHEGEVVMA